MLLSIGGLEIVLASSELGNQLKSLLFTLEHLILHGSTADQSLQKNDGLALSVTLVGGHVFDTSFVIDSLELVEQISLISLALLLSFLLAFLLSLLLLDLDELRLDSGLSSFQLIDVLSLSTSQAFDELVLEVIHADLRVESLVVKGSGQFLDALVT